jgi:hypothetical protein
MGAHSTPALGGVALLAAALLLGCGGNDDAAPAATLSDAESLVGVALLPAGGGVAAADSLRPSELPPDGSATAVVDDEDMPPSS